MKRIAFLVTSLLWATLQGFAQPKPEAKPLLIIDTLMLNTDSIVVYSDKSWEYIETLNFTGVMNKHLDYVVRTDSNYQFKQGWNSHEVYSNDNHLVNMKDTIWMCTVDSSNQPFAMPADGPVNSTFKYRGRRFHYGVDIDLETGDPVRSAFAGKVRYAKYNSSGFGNLVVVRHDNGLETYYAHLSKFKVKVNDRVEAGQLVGLGGATGRVTGSHLHFEVRFYDNAIDPQLVFDFKNKKLADENLFIHKGLFEHRAVSSSRGSVVASKDVKYHKVRSGDSLYAISRRYHTKIDTLCALNGIKKTKVLRIGEVLKVR